MNYASNPFDPNYDDTKHVTDSVSRDEYISRFNREIIELEAKLPHGVRPGHDPFATDDEADNSGYSRNKFYVETVRKKRDGGSPRYIQVPFDPIDFQIIQQILHKGLVPQYRTQQDLIRDAVHHRLHDLTHGVFEDGLKIYLADEKFVDYDRKRRVMIEIAESTRQMKEETLAVEQLNEGLKHAVNSGNRQRVQQLLIEAKKLLDGELGDYNRDVIHQLVDGYEQWLTRTTRTEFQVQTDRITPHLPTF